MSDLRDFLMRRAGLSAHALDKLIATAPERYAVYSIPKRSGGCREIAQPAYEVKELQRLVLERYLISLPVHSAASAYEKGASIRKNAEAHKMNGPIKKYDFQNFFPSITEFSWLSYCEDKGLFERSDALMMARILFRRPRGGRILRLSIGAPTSSKVSNLLMFDFDKNLNEAMLQEGVTYTRYADDLTFSADRTGHLTTVDHALRKAIRELRYPKLKLNEEKTVTATKKYRRKVTGIVLTNDSGISVGRDRKRLVRAKIHHFSCGKLDIEDSVRLAGELLFINSIEDDFLDRMIRVYGSVTIKSLTTLPRRYERTMKGKI